MSFTDGKQFQVSQEILVAMKRANKRFHCPLCGHDFTAFDRARWVFANFKESPVACGNFFVCEKCDAPNDVLLQCAKLAFDDAVKKAKNWGIYGGR